MPRSGGSIRPRPMTPPTAAAGRPTRPSDGAPFQTMNSLILSYIDQALSSIVPANTSGSNVATNPASLSVTAFDGLGTFTFSATAGYDIDGSIVSGSFSTTDSATLLYSFHEVGYTPDGSQFTLNDQGGGTLNIHADNGNSLTHSLTNTLAASDSYALIQVLAQSDAVAGSYTSAESTTDTVGGSDNFTMTETQTETVNTSGSITGGADNYAYNETGTDTSSLSDQDSDTVAGTGGVSDNGTSSSGGPGSGGHTDHVTGTDALGAGGFLPQGTNSFTWSGQRHRGAHDHGGRQRQPRRCRERRRPARPRRPRRPATRRARERRVPRATPTARGRVLAGTNGSATSRTARIRDRTRGPRPAESPMPTPTAATGAGAGRRSARRRPTTARARSPSG